MKYFYWVAWWLGWVCIVGGIGMGIWALIAGEPIWAKFLIAGPIIGLINIVWGAKQIRAEKLRELQEKQEGIPQVREK